MFADRPFLFILPNKLLHLHQTLSIHQRKVTQKPNFETHPKPDRVDSKMYSTPQDIANERASDNKANQEDQFVDFNMFERVRNVRKVSDLLEQWLPQRSQQRVKKIIQSEGSGEILSNDQMRSQANKSQETFIKVPEKLN